MGTIKDPVALVSPALVASGQTIGTISFTPATLTVGGITTASATATSGLTVSFSSTTTGICTVSGTNGSTVTGVAGGTCTIAADQAGDSGYSAATQVRQSLTVSTTISASVNGACGTANGTATAFAPATNLCATGTSGAVSGSTSWTWSCAGSGGGTNASCAAPYQTTPSNNGTGSATVGGGAWAVDTAQSSGFIATTGHAKSPPSLPPGYTFPYGLFDFTLNTGAIGTAATITITYPAALPVGAVYWKYGPSPAGYNCTGAGCAAAHWYQMPPAQAVVAGNTITLTITDGGVGDDDLAANGVIVDQGGSGVPDGGVAGIPTLSEWALLALAGLMGLLGMGALRRRAVL
ncbi:MAG: IPTL-CTERM sorting domain-containing protein [Gallionella sp.]|nr:IPTL-CTERM sorting domain-containing protein [Gallionella sp.]